MSKYYMESVYCDNPTLEISKEVAEFLQGKLGFEVVKVDNDKKKELCGFRNDECVP